MKDPAPNSPVTRPSAPCPGETKFADDYRFRRRTLDPVGCAATPGGDTLYNGA
jgi:hypothetical protein